MQKVHFFVISEMIRLNGIEKQLFDAAKRNLTSAQFPLSRPDEVLLRRMDEEGYRAE
jgi:hypothetical protein